MFPNAVGGSGGVHVAVAVNDQVDNQVDVDEVVVEVLVGAASNAEERAARPPHA